MARFDAFLSFCRTMQQFPENPDEVQLEPIVRALRSGEASEEQKNWIIEQHLRVTLATVARYVNPYKMPDFVAEAFLVLVQLVKREAHKSLTDNNITAWIVSTLKHRIKGFWFKFHSVEKAIDEEEITVEPQQEVVDVIDFLGALARNEREKLVLQCAIDGCTGMETSVVTHLSRATISETMVVLRKRYHALAA